MHLSWLYLKTWTSERSSRLCSDIYKATANLKSFGFRDQITRSGLSVPSNIAEEYERDSEKKKTNFLKFSKSSNGDSRDQIYIGMEIGYINKELGKTWPIETREISKMLLSLIQLAKTKS